MIELFNHTLFTFRIEGSGVIGTFFWATVTTALRLMALYAVIRVVLMALHSGGVL